MLKTSIIVKHIINKVDGVYITFWIRRMVKVIRKKSTTTKIYFDTVGAQEYFLGAGWADPPNAPSDSIFWLPVADEMLAVIL
jgi:hypothetical protein